MSRFRVQIMNQFERKSHEYKAIKRYWKLIQQDSRKLSDKRFYRPTFRMHLTNKEILDKILSYSEDLKHHYQIYQLLLFHFQNKDPEKFFGLIEDNLKQVHPLFQTVFKTFLVRCRVKIITMDMFSPYYDLAKQLRFQISRLRLKQSPRLFHSRMLKSFLIAFTLYNILAVL
ncbi:degenerate transposase (orf2) [Streptococcus pneumoniae]|nr:degenerate transposase (orf2) [Streptococcus pneumoniae]